MGNHKFLIYHGSSSIINLPELKKGKTSNDYGQGFYTTKNLTLAKEWAVNENQDGYVSMYELDLSGLKILNLSSLEYSTLHWISLLLQNRIFDLKNDLSKIGKQYLIEHYLLLLDDYDVIKGYRGDDLNFAYAQGFLNNTISLEKLNQALHLGNLGEQMVLISPKAFNHLTFLGSEIASWEIYYPLRKQRNESARENFLLLTHDAFSLDDLYLSDIIKGGQRQ